VDELPHLFRLLHFLGAPVGFAVNWWRFPADRVVEPEAWPTRAEVNGGWTYMGHEQIWMFRDEEWDRVLIHECIHAFKWDAVLLGETKACLEGLLEGQVMPALFEAATELNAEWLWCVIHSPATDYEAATWATQRAWQHDQALSILARRGEKWTEDTSVFAYYVLKAALALRTEEFLVEWLSGHLNSAHWCEVWSANKAAFEEEAGRKNTDQPLSMRMTNPVLD
jgi:hypothetical protein